MSLEELLKDSEGSPAWKVQRRKLIRLALGISVSALALIAGVLFLNSYKKNQRNQSAVIDQDKQVQSLAQLMRVQREAKRLEDDLNHIKRTPSSNATPGGYRRARPLGAVRIVNYDPGDGFALVDRDKQEIYIPTGAVFQAQLLTPIKTSVEKTFVMAETTNEFRMDMKRRIPRGSRLIGRSHFDPVLKGVVVEFDTIVFPNGIESTLSGLALSRNALPEIDGLYFSDRMTTYGTALAFGFLSGFADAGREREVTILGSQPEVSVSNQVLAGLSTASFQVANEILRDIRANAIEYVVVPAGEQVFVVLTRRYDINPGGLK